ncbi:MAG: DnaJ C-terminal domain-containing protein [Pseudomonadota bacterium]
MEHQDYYRTLGVEASASPEQVKRAYRKLVRQYHPDLSGASDADRMTKAINEAYSVLGDAEKRAAYDAQRAPRRQRQPSYDWDTARDSNDSGDFFADLFSHLGRRGANGFGMRGQDLHASVEIELGDAYHGANRSLVLRLIQSDLLGRPVERARTLNVRIPRGVQAGQQLRLAGQGQTGSGGAPAGHLLLEIHFRPDPRYRVEGRQVHLKVPVTPWEAALGAQIDVATPLGVLQVQVPAGSQAGRKLRLKGCGIPGLPPGDLFLALEVVLPPASSDKARALYQAMARELAFNPRVLDRA